MALSDVVARVVAFLRAGYPHGVPATDYVPLIALLRRRLSDDEVVAVASELAARGELPIDAHRYSCSDHQNHRRDPLARRSRARPAATAKRRVADRRPARRTGRLTVG